jgi:choline-glycine betaine transporter
MSGLCTSGLTVDDQESPIALKVVWGLTIGGMCLVMLISAGIDGVKMASNLGGFPNVFLLVLLCVAFAKVMKNPKKYDTYKDDYDDRGRPIPSDRLNSENFTAESKASKWRRIFIEPAQ